MIQYKKSQSGLLSYPITYRDISEYSHNYFKLVDFPDTFYVGKNLFRILGDADKLVPKSKVYIDIFDANGNTIYYEVVPIVTQEKSKIISVYIYADTPPGRGKIYIGGRLAIDPVTHRQIPYIDDMSSPNYINTPNVIWSRDINIVTTKGNGSDVFFITDPIVTYKKRNERSRTLLTSSETLIMSSSGNFTIKTGITPSVHGGGGVTKETSNIAPKNNVQVDDGYSTVDRARLPEHLNLTTLTSDTFEFTEQMVGGTVTLNNINITERVPPIVKTSAAQLTGFVYSGSIVNIVNKNSVQLDTPFIISTSYTQEDGNSGVYTLTKLINHTDFTGSFYSTPTYSDTPTTASFITFDIKNMEPVGGVVKKLGIRYKVSNNIGDFVNLGEYDVVERNILIDPSNILLSPTDGIIERPLGKFTQQVLNTYWTASCVDSNRIPTASISDTMLNAARVTYTGDMDEVNSPVVFELLPTYAVQLYANTEYKLSFDYTTINSTSNTQHQLSFDYTTINSTSNTQHQLDVYVSGSDILTDKLPSVNYNPLVDRNLGVYIGSISNKVERGAKSVMYFKTLSDGVTVPKFAIRKGQYDISNVEIIPRTDIGFSPNHYRLNVRANDFEVGDLLIDIMYKNEGSIPSNAISHIDKLNISELDKDYNLRIGSLTLTYRGMLTAQAGQMRYLGSVNVPVSCSVENFYTMISGSSSIYDTSFDVQRGSIYTFSPVYDVSSSIIPSGSVSMYVRSSASYSASAFDTSTWKAVGNDRAEVLNFYASASGWVPGRDTLTTMIMVIRKL